MKVIPFTPPLKSLDDYWELEFKLAKMADSFKLTRERLVEHAHLMPEYIHAQVQDIIEEQEYVLEKI